jgi:putative MATE family efflux protein|tara:strand:- start:507 stop:1811 length:1305 start_codon:yes stop_codon:yes gene_type:complete
MAILSRDKQLLKLAVPALGALLAEPLYVLADTAVVGHLGTSSLGGLGVSSSALLLIYGLCFFLAYGTTATIARLAGAKEERKAASQIVQSIWLAVMTGLFLGTIVFLFSTQLLKAMGANGDLLNQARIYLRVSMYGAPAMLIMLAGVGYLRGVKDTVRPLWVSVGTAVLNLVLELVLIYRFKMGIGASAAATVVAQWTGAGIYLFWIAKAIRPHQVSLVPRFALLKRLLQISVQLFMRNLSLAGTFLFATAVATRISDIDIAAHQVAFQMWFTLAMAMDAMAIAAQAMIGNLLGAGDSKEAQKVGERTIIWSVGIGVVGGGVLAATHLPLAQVFSNDPSVIALSGFLFLHVALMAPLSGVAFALDGILIGAGDHNYLAKAMTTSAIFTIPLMSLTRIWDLGIGWLWAVIWLFMGLRSVLLGARFLSGRWQVTGT